MPNLNNWFQQSWLFSYAIFPAANPNITFLKNVNSATDSVTKDISLLDRKADREHNGVFCGDIEKIGDADDFW